MAKDLFAELRNTLLSLEGLLRATSSTLLKSNILLIEKKMAKAQRLAERIGGQTLLDTNAFKQQVDRLLLGEMDIAEMHGLLVQALKLEQETREL
jgi:hypothetical protein